MSRASDFDPDGRRLPVKIGRTSNGEFFPPALTPMQQLANRLAHEAASENARHLGLGRRAFLVSATGAASTLVAATGEFDCFSAQVLAKEVFLDSDTDVAVVSTLWGEPSPTPIDSARSRQGHRRRPGVDPWRCLPAGTGPDRIHGRKGRTLRCLGLEDVHSIWRGRHGHLPDGPVRPSNVRKSTCARRHDDSGAQGLPLPGLAYEYSRPRPWRRRR